MRSWNVGTPVRFQLDDGPVVPGQVWADGPTEGVVWVALDDHRFARVNTADGTGTLFSANGHRLRIAGKVAA